MLLVGSMFPLLKAYKQACAERGGGVSPPRDEFVAILEKCIEEEEARLEFINFRGSTRELFGKRIQDVEVCRVRDCGVCGVLD